MEKDLFLDEVRDETGGHVGGGVELEGLVDGGSKRRADGGCLEKGRGRGESRILEVWRTGIGYQLQHLVLRQTRLERTRGAELDAEEAITHS